MMQRLAEDFRPHVWMNAHSGMEALFMPYDHKATIPQGAAAAATFPLLQELNRLSCGGRCAVGSGGKSVGEAALPLPSCCTGQGAGEREKARETERERQRMRLCPLLSRARGRGRGSERGRVRGKDNVVIAGREPKHGLEAVRGHHCVPTVLMCPGDCRLFGAWHSHRLHVRRAEGAPGIHLGDFWGPDCPLQRLLPHVQPPDHAAPAAGAPGHAHRSCTAFLPLVLLILMLGMMRQNVPCIGGHWAAHQGRDNRLVIISVALPEAEQDPFVRVVLRHSLSMQADKHVLAGGD